MNRDSTPAVLLLAFFAVMLVGAPNRDLPAQVAASHRSMPEYERGAELSLTGVVEGMPRVHQATSPIIVTLRTQRQSYDLVLAPASYVADAGLAFIKGDRILVTGASGRLNDEDVVFVREVTTATLTVPLRTVCGAPLWVTP